MGVAVFFFQCHWKFFFWRKKLECKYEANENGKKVSDFEGKKSDFHEQWFMFFRGKNFISYIIFVFIIINQIQMKTSVEKIFTKCWVWACPEHCPRAFGLSIISSTSMLALGGCPSLILLLSDLLEFGVHLRPLPTSIYPHPEHWFFVGCICCPVV